MSGSIPTYEYMADPGVPPVYSFVCVVRPVYVCVRPVRANASSTAHVCPAGQPTT